MAFSLLSPLLSASVIITVRAYLTGATGPGARTTMVGGPVMAQPLSDLSELTLDFWSITQSHVAASHLCISGLRFHVKDLRKKVLLTREMMSDMRRWIDEHPADPAGLLVHSARGLNSFHP